MSLLKRMGSKNDTCLLMRVSDEEYVIIMLSLVDGNRNMNTAISNFGESFRLFNGINYK